MSKLGYEIVQVTALKQNCTVLWCKDTYKAVVVDPGEVGELPNVLNAQGLQLTKVLVTHNHYDHVGGASELAEMFKVPIVSSFMGDRVEEGDSIEFGSQKLHVIACPGHTPEHIVFANHAEKLLLTGDTLFCRSIAITHYAGGDYETLLRSIVRKLLPLDSYAFIPGHGAKSTIAYEIQCNPYFQ